MRISFFLAGLLAFLCLSASCAHNSLRLKNISMDLYSLYPGDAWSATNDNGLRRVMLDPYVLVISEDNRLSLNGHDIEDIRVSTNDNLVHLSLIFKKTVRQELLSFTTRNTNSLVAVMVEGQVRNIARIDGPVRNGRLKFSARLSRMPDIQNFVRLFLL